MREKNDSTQSKEPVPQVQSVEKQIAELIRENVGVDPETLKKGFDSSLEEDLDLDSLEVDELAMELQEHFFVDLTDEEVEHTKTIKDLADLVRKKLVEQQIVRLIAKVTEGRVSVDPQTQLELGWVELGVDIVNLVQLIAEDEHAFHILISNPKMGNIHNIKQLVDFVLEPAKQQA